MPKVVAMNGAHAAHAEPFDPLADVPIEIPLPFPGQWGRITAAYSMAAVYNVADQYKTLFVDLQPAIDAANEAAKSSDQAVKLQALADGRRLDNLTYIRVIGKVVLHFSWPFAGNPPDPTDEAALAQWADPVLKWLAGGGMQEVRQRVEDPKAWTASAAT
jgi:hypothetical protein